MTKQARVSIGIPVFNGENHLAEALNSFLRQTYRDFEILISDDASTDATAEICRSYAARDSRIRYFSQADTIGVGPNRARVLDMSQALYFKWAAQDGIYAPTYLEACVNVLDRRPDVVLAHADGPLIDAAGKPLPFDIFRQSYMDRMGKRYVREPIDIARSDVPSERFDDVLHRIVWGTAIYGLFRRDAASRVTLKWSQPGSDKLFLAEMALLGKFHHSKEPLFMRRCDTTTSAQTANGRRSAFMDGPGPKAYPSFELLKGYTRAALKVGTLDFAERLHCVASVARNSVRARYWRRGEEI